MHLRFAVKLVASSESHEDVDDHQVVVDGVNLS